MDSVIFKTSFKTPSLISIQKRKIQRNPRKTNQLSEYLEIRYKRGTVYLHYEMKYVGWAYHKRFEWKLRSK